MISEVFISGSDRIATAAALCLALALAVFQLGPMTLAPGAFLVGSHIHPDNLANQWLLPWATEAVQTGAPLLHTTDYFWPVGDAPLLSGDGTQALVYAPLHLGVGWPAATPLFVGVTLFLNGLCGWFAARTVVRSPTAAWMAIGICGWSPFVLMELSAGRFSQAATWPLLLFLGLWWRHLARPSAWLAVLSALTLAYTAFSYWYYGWFGVLAGAAAWLVTLRDHAWAAHRHHLRWHALFVGTFLVTLAPWAMLFLSHWASVPGVGETDVFPPASAMHDRLPLLGSLQPGTPATTSAMWSVVAGVLAALGAWSARGVRAVRAWVAVGVLFLALGWGPAFSGAPYTVLYGIHAALRRFWWPMRHVVVVHAAVAVLASIGLDALLRRLSTRQIRPVAAAIVGFTGGTFFLQGAPSQVQHSPLLFPPDGYDTLAELPAGAVVSFPLAPEATGTNDAMLHQLAHGHPMVTGHSPWVERARPPAWDSWLAAQPFLHALSETERHGWSGGYFSVDPADIEALQHAGVRWLVLDRTLVPLKLKDLVRHHDRLFDALFDRPVIRTADLQVWDLHAYTGQTTVLLPTWSWPSGLVPAGPEWPLASRRPNSPMLGPPSGKRKRKQPRP